MRANLNTLAQIDRYLNGEMNLAEQSTFEIQMSQNKDLENKVEQQQLIIQATKRQVLLNQINAVATTGGAFQFVKWIIGLGTLVVLLGGVYFLTKDNSSVLEPTIAKSTQIIKPATQNQTKKTAVTIPIVDSLALTNSQNLPVTSGVKSKKIKSKKSKVTKVDSNPKSTTTFYDFNGLQCWVKPNVQTFEINANLTETVEGEQGTLIIIPENTFTTENGNIVQGKVKFELVEAYDLADMLLYNLTTMADDKTLETGGMFYTNATQNGQKLTINANKPLLIQIPCVEEKEGMMAFESEIDSSGNINWKNPKPLEKWLTKVDMNTLDFLPTNFENEVYANMPIMGFEKADRKVVNTLYYSFGYESQQIENGSDRIISNHLFKSLFKLLKRENSQGGTTYVKKKKNSEVYGEFKGVPISVEQDTSTSKESVNCGIHPLSIKAIHENKEYSQSFLATKEFEARIKELHKLENGQEMLDVYLNNLDKNLWYSDSIVANNMSVEKRRKSKIKSSQKPNVFSQFYAKRKTKVKDGDLYAQTLTKYYNKKKKEYIEARQKILNQNESNLEKSIKQLENLQKSTNRKNSQQNKLTNLNVSRGNNYTVAWSSFGWANIDGYLHLLEKGSKEVKISAVESAPKGNFKIYQWLGAISTLTPIIVNQFKGIVKVPKAGGEGALKMANTYALGISNDNNQWFFGSKKYNPYETDKIDIDLMEVTIDELKRKLNQFSGTSPLTKQITEEIKKLKALEKSRQQKQKEEDFIQKLKSLCFKCFDLEKITLKIPEVITPNGDGLNDYFELDFKGKYPDIEVLIYDLSFALVFKGKKGYEKLWGGNFKGKKNGTYNYVINLNHPDYPDPITGVLYVRDGIVPTETETFTN